MNKIDIREKKLDFSILRERIFQGKTIKEISYLIMNSETLNDLWHLTNDMLPIEKWNCKGSSYATYLNIPIAVCEKLLYGEVEIV